jgi:uracil-DNA glycosylase
VRYLFVGERPSRTAHERGYTWQSGNAAGRTLRDALAACGVKPESQEYINLWTGPEPHAGDERDCQKAIREIRRTVRSGYVVVALGQKVARELSRARVCHRQAVHPAARGRIRGKAVYQRHIAEVLA